MGLGNCKTQTEGAQTRTSGATDSGRTTWVRRPRVMATTKMSMPPLLMMTLMGTAGVKWVMVLMLLVQQRKLTGRPFGPPHRLPHFGMVAAAAPQWEGW